MLPEPDFASFAAAYEAGQPSVLWTRLVADLDTPVSAMMKMAQGRPNSFLLESVQGGAIRGRYSFIGLRPDLIWRCRGGQAEINRRPAGDAAAFVPCPAPPIQALRELLAESRIELPASLPPMAAGLFGYFGYDMVRLMERLPTGQPPALDLPDGIFLRPTITAIFDNIEDRVTIVTPVRPEPGIDAAAAYAAAIARLETAVDDFARPLLRSAPSAAPPPRPPSPQSNVAHDDFHAMVEKAKRYIFAGDIFQVVLSQRFAVPFPLPPFALYRALRRLNPSPFLFFLDFGDFAAVGSSPEILVRLRDGTVTIRPLAGTRRRGADAEEDRRLAEELLADPKELAEHLMPLDLARNDVGRVAKIGTVRVTDQFMIERYSHVMHICSHVEGRIDPRYGALDALVAGFPAGTLSGAPKVRAMEIIDELETERRNLYGGAAGY